jgi:hypothetical protein
MYINPFFIAVNPVGSKFAKGLQAAIREKVTNKVFRQLPGRIKAGRSRFMVTAQPLDKIQQFRRFTDAGVQCPKWTTDVSKIGELDAKTVFARTLINSTNGRGIVEFDVGVGEPPRAPLYTAYIPKKAEYRVHVLGGSAIDVQQKRKKKGVEERDTRIRNLHNGYVYCRDGIVLPEGAADLAVRAVAALGYEYGAVDLIYNEKRNQCYVLEVNSRPGLMGSTLENYANALINKYELRRK